MFVIGTDIKVGAFEPFKASSITWNRNIDNHSDSAAFTIPTQCMLVGSDKTYSYMPTANAFKEGMTVEITAGYNGEHTTRFKGFIKRINMKVPIEIECEGYAYLLRRVVFSKGYTKATTIKQLIQDLLAAGGLSSIIKLHPKFQDVTFEPFTFKTYSGIEVLEFLKKWYKVTVFFLYDTIYVGLRETLWSNSIVAPIKLSLGWNVIKDDKLLFSADKEYAQVNIMAVSKNMDGTRNKALNRLLQPGGTKIEKLLSRDSKFLQAVANQQKTMLTYRGYSGVITAFLDPLVQPGDSVLIEDPVYDRSGRYFVESIVGSITRGGGGRQTIGIGNSI